MEEFSEGATEGDTPSGGHLVHHEKGKFNQIRFRLHVRDMLDVIHSNGGPFRDGETELDFLYRRVCVDPSQIKVAKRLDAVGRMQYGDFRNSVFQKRSRDLHAPIKKNKLTVLKQIETTENMDAE